MKRLYSIMFFLMSAYYGFSQANAGPDRVICSGSGIEIGNMPEDSKLCYSWKASPADPNIANAKTAKITVNPTKTTTYTLTVIGQDFSSSSNDDVKVTVINPAKYTIDFEENPNQNFGFDKVAGNNDIYLSPDKNSSTKVNVKVTPFTADAFCVTSSDPSKFKVTNDSVLLTGATTTIDLIGQNAGGSHESVLLEVRCTNKKGTILKTLHVELYRKVSFDFSFYRIKDGTSPGTMPALNLSLNQIKMEGNKIYKQAVIEIASVNGNANIDIQYDINKNGYMDFYRGGANPELSKIQGSGLTGDPQIAYIAKLRSNWYLASPAKAKDSKIQLTNVDFLTSNKSYSIGSANGSPEIITITNIDLGTKTITLASPLKFAHDLTHTVYEPLLGLSSNPQLVTDEGLGVMELIKTIIHEVLHRPNMGNLSDLDAPDNLMHFGLSGNLLRYRDQPRHYNPPGGKEMQWNTIPR